jgi:hypothetical protein
VNQWTLFSQTHANQKGYVVGHLMTKATILLSLKIFATNPPNTVLLTNDCLECAATLNQV